MNESLTRLLAETRDLLSKLGTRGRSAEITLEELEELEAALGSLEAAIEAEKAAREGP